jgi:hypothetical protein
LFGHVRGTLAVVTVPRPAHALETFDPGRRAYRYHSNRSSSPASHRVTIAIQEVGEVRGEIAPNSKK